MPKCTSYDEWPNKSTVISRGDNFTRASASIATRPDLVIDIGTSDGGESTILRADILVKNRFLPMYNLDRRKLKGMIEDDSRYETDPVFQQLSTQLKEHEFDSRAYGLESAHIFRHSVVCGGNCHGKDDCQHQDHNRFRDAVSTAASSEWNTPLSGLPPNCSAPSSSVVSTGSIKPKL